MKYTKTLIGVPYVIFMQAPEFSGYNLISKAKTVLELMVENKNSDFQGQKSTERPKIFLCPFS